MKSKTRAPLGFALSLALAYSASAHAAFSPGNSIEAAYFFPDLSTPFVAGVTTDGPTDFIANYATWLDITYTDNSISIRLTRDGGPNHTSFDGVRFTDLVGNLHFENYNINAAETSISGFTLAKGNNSLTLNFADTSGSANQRLVLESSPVPLPAGMWLLTPALVGLAALRRKAKS